MSRDHSEALIEFDFSRAENTAETSEKHSMVSNDERQEPSKGNIWETRAKERQIETKQTRILRSGRLQILLGMP